MLCAVCSPSPFIEKNQASHKSRQHFMKIVFRQSDHSFFLSKTFFSFQKKPNYIPIYLIFNITLCILNTILMTILILHLVQCFPSTLASALHLNDLTYFINAFGIPMHISLNLFFIYTGIFFFLIRNNLNAQYDINRSNIYFYSSNSTLLCGCDVFALWVMLC